MFIKSNLIRVVRLSKDKFCIDHSHKINGRGSYLCNNPECLRKSKKNRGFEHSFKSKFAAAIYEDLENELEKNL